MKELTEKEAYQLAKDYHSMQRYYRMGCDEYLSQDLIYIELREQFLLIASCHSNGGTFYETKDSIQIKIGGALLDAYTRTLLIEDIELFNIPFIEGTRVYAPSGDLLKQW